MHYHNPISHTEKRDSLIPTGTGTDAVLVSCFIDIYGVGIGLHLDSRSSSCVWDNADTTGVLGPPDGVPVFRAVVGGNAHGELWCRCRLCSVSGGSVAVHTALVAGFEQPTDGEIF